MWTLFKSKAEEAIERFLSEQFLSDRLNSEGPPEDLFETFLEKFVGSLYTEAEPWWDLEEQDMVRLKDLSDLLVANAALWSSLDRFEEPPPPWSAQELLRRYGIWVARNSHREAIQYLFDHAYKNFKNGQFKVCEGQQTSV
jgi:hypothetical protein